MSKIRLASQDETIRQKEIWKRCFGDPDSYIDFYYLNRYKEDETLVLLCDDDIAAMLTRISVGTVVPGGQSFKTAMLYAIATHPKYQKRGLASELIDYSSQFLSSQKNELSVLVPAQSKLFDFYRKLGFQDGFYIYESLLTLEQIENLSVSKLNSCSIFPVSPAEYNLRREKLLEGRLFISYTEEDIAYQKKLSQQSGADIYAINIGSGQIKGCITIERITTDKIIIKEFLIPEEYINIAAQKIAQCLPAKDYFLRTPAYLKTDKQLGGSIRPFGMIKIPENIKVTIRPQDLGYLGLAFD